MQQKRRLHQIHIWLARGFISELATWVKEAYKEKETAIESSKNKKK
jgi:hypothetical protein